MKKTRILSAVLSAIMAASSVVMSGCGEKSLESQNNETNAAATTSIRRPVTLNMFVKTNDSTTPEAAREVQMAINEITVPKYKTTVKINYLKEADYWAAIDAAEQAVIDYDEQQKAIADAEKAAKEEARKNMTPEEIRKADREEKKRKEEEEKSAAESEEDLAAEFSELIDDIYEADDIELEIPQIDIFFADSADKLLELVKDERIEPLNAYLDYESKSLKSYIYPTFLAAAKTDGKVYGIPANKNLGGEYEYFVYDKALLEKYDFEVDDLVEIREMKNYLALIKQNEPGVIPLTKPTSLSGWEYFGGEVGAFGIYKKDTTTGWPSDVAPIFNDKKYFLRHYEALESYRESGYFANSYPAGSPFAIDVRVSETRPLEEFEENGKTYVTYIYKLPRAKAESVLSTSWVVSAYSKNKDRAMEIITLFNTNATLSNLLRYGIENVNYFYDQETNTVEMADDTYSMNADYTGNRYIQYVTEQEKDYIEQAKKKNLDSVAGAFVSFKPELEEQEAKSLEAANEIARKYIGMIERGEMSVEQAFEQGKAEMDAIEKFSSLTGTIQTEYNKYVATVSSSYVIAPIVLERIEANQAKNNGTADDVETEEQQEQEIQEEASQETEEQAAQGEQGETEAQQEPQDEGEQAETEEIEQAA